MKKLIILAILLSSCSTTKKAKPCTQCPQYNYDIEFQYLDLNPYPLEISYEKPD